MAVHHYGQESLQYGELDLPTETPPSSATWPVVALIHGGFWRNPYRLDFMYPLATDLTSQNYAAWNVEYRCGGDVGGGYPGTLSDVGKAIDHLETLAETEPLDLNRVAVVGHSAGGHLALWCASRHLLRAADVGSGPLVGPALVVSQAGVVDLSEAAHHNLGDGAAQEFLGGTPEQVPDTYRVAQPILEPERTYLVHGSQDDKVPLSQSVQAAKSSGSELAIIDGADQFDVIDPNHEAWAVVMRWLSAL